MKSRVMVVTMLVAAALAAGCSSGPNSLGVALYDPTGLAFRHKLESDKTLNVALGMNGLAGAEVAHGHVDYIMHFDSIDGDAWNPYWGLGLSYLFLLDDTVDNDNVGLGLRVPLGVSYQADGWDFFAELAAHVGGFIGISGGVGVRFGL